MEPAAFGRSTAKLRESIAHDAAAAGEATSAQLAPYLHGIAAAFVSACGEILPVGIKQAGRASTPRPLGERIGVCEAPHGATVEIHGQTNRPDRLAGFVAAHYLFASGPVGIPDVRCSDAAKP
jgi:hypothetical protein